MVKAKMGLLRLSKLTIPDINSEPFQRGPFVLLAFRHLSRQGLVLQLEDVFLLARDTVAQSKKASQQTPDVKHQELQPSQSLRRCDAATLRLQLKVRSLGDDTKLVHHGRIQ